MIGHDDAPDTLPPYTRLMRDGALIDLERPDWRRIGLLGLSLQLADINRWSGALSRPVSDAEHCLAVAALCPQDLRLAALLHDAHEAFICDIPRPLKRLFAALCQGFARELHAIEWGLDVAIARAVLDPHLQDDGAAAAAAEDLAVLMRHPDLKAADEEAARLELHRFGPVEGRAPNFAYGHEPNRLGQAKAWLDAVQREAAALAARGVPDGKR